MGYGQPAARQPARASTRSTTTPTGWSPEVDPGRPELPRLGAGQERSRGAAGASASSSPACSATSAWPRSPWPTATPTPAQAADDDKDQGRQGQRQGRQNEEAPAQGRAARGVPRPGDQGHRDARSRPLAGPAAQLQGQHDADGRPAQRHGDHPRQGPGRQRDGLQPDQHRPQGQEAGRLLLDHARPYDYWAIEYAYKPVDGRRGGRAQEDRRAGPRARPGLRDRRRRRS